MTHTTSLSQLLSRMQARDGAATLDALDRRQPALDR